MKTNTSMRNGLRRVQSGLRLPMLACVLVAVAACGNKEKGASQSLVKVNGEEITVFQLNDEMARAGGAAVASKKQILDSLVERQLLIDEAMKIKADRDPKVVQAIERAKMQILAESYLRGKLGSVPKPAKADIDSFYEKNPLLFADRKSFKLRQVVLDRKDFSDDVLNQMKTATSLDQVVGWLNERKITFGQGVQTRTSAELPMELVKVMITMPKGRIFTIKERERVQLVALLDVEAAPISREAAAGQIEQYLTTQNLKEASRKEIERLRASAKIEFMNKEDELAAAPAAAPAANPVTPAAAPAKGPDLGRGVAGLK